jgi:SecA DEAD-like domain
MDSTMRRIMRWTPLPLVIAAAAYVVPVGAFVTSSTSSRTFLSLFVPTPPPLAWCGDSGSTHVRHDHSFASASSSSTTTSLRMGAFEDFISGADASKRSKDNQAYLKSLSARVDRINSLESTIEELDDDELQAKTREFRTRLANGEDMNGPLLEEAFAVVREAAWYV